MGSVMGGVPAAPAPEENGQRTPAARPDDRRSKEVECPNQDTPHSGTMRLPPGALLPPRHCATPAPKILRCGLGEGPPHLVPPRPKI